MRPAGWAGCATRWRPTTRVPSRRPPTPSAAAAATWAPSAVGRRASASSWPLRSSSWRGCRRSWRSWKRRWMRSAAPCVASFRRRSRPHDQVIAPLLQGREDPRLATARRLRLLEAPRERRFAHVTRLARELFDVPIAIVNLGEPDLEQFQPADNGLDLLVVADMRADVRFRNHPLVREEPCIRFYAGQVLRDVEGERTGTLCLLDRRPRSFSARDALLFRMLADLVEP